MDVEKDKQGVYDELIRQVIASKEIPKLYINGFVNFYGAADVGIILKTNDVPTVMLNMSYTVAKTLAEKLNKLVVNFEEQTGNIIMTTDYIEGKISGSKNDDSLQ